MNTLLRLLVANVKLRPARTALTALAVVASSCVVVWVVSGYDALIGRSVDDDAARALGRYQLILNGNGGGRPSGAMTKGAGSPATPRKGQGGATAKGAGPGRGGGGGGFNPGAVAAGFSREFIQTLKRDPQLAEANLTTRGRVSVGRIETDPEAEANVRPISKVFRGDRPPIHGLPPMEPPLIGTDAVDPPYALTDGQWIDPTAPATDKLEAVLSANHAASLSVAVGDTIRVVSEVGEWKVRLVGIVEQPPSGGGRFGGGGGQTGIFVSLPLAEAINGYPSRVNRINLVVKEGVDPSAYRETLEKRLAETNTPGSVTDLQALRESMAQGLSQSSSRALAYSATGIALVAALFIIFTTLSMGVSERTRELAVLRAIGLTRGQVAGLVFLEGLFLALLGWIGGLAAGWGLLAVVARARPDMMAGGASIGGWCVLLTAIAAVGGALAASILPAWRATRVTPIDAMAPPRVASPARWVIPSALLGLAFLAINPLLTYVIPMSDESRTWAYVGIGYPGMVVGFVLLAPWVILLVERLFSPIVARALGLPVRLLGSLLSANLWRTLGTTVALTVGLGLYVATQTWGYSMLAPFLPGAWVPDVLVGFEPSGLPIDALEKVKQVPGVDPSRTVAMTVEQPRLATPIDGRGGFLVKQDNVVLAGVDPDRAFSGDDPVIDAAFLVGDRAHALAKLKAGRACLVPDHFLDSGKFQIGDHLELIPANGPPGATVRYEIVGGLDLSGWFWITKTTGLRRRMTRTGALVFAPIADVQRDFAIDRINFVWFDTNKSVSDSDLEAAMQTIAEQRGETKFQVPGVGEIESKRPYARLTSTATIRSSINDRADGMIWGMSRIPFITLLITSLAVVNTVVSSVRARQWDMGILRAIGTTRFGIVRLILAESILIGLAVCVLGVGFGLMAGWCGIGMSALLSPFGGLRSPLILPWKSIALVSATALGLCLLAALWPAITTGRREPLKLLQAGRGAA